MIVGYVFGLILCVSCYRAGQQLALFIAMAPGCRLDFPQRVAAWCGRNAAVVRSTFLCVLAAEFSLLMVQVFTCGQPTYSAYLPGSQHYVPGSCADDTPSPAPLFDLFFAPFGVWLRWRLGLLNGRFKTFAIGTFAANIIACAIDCFIAGAEYRYTFDPWSLMIMTAVCSNSFNPSYAPSSNYVLSPNSPTLTLTLTLTLSATPDPNPGCTPLTLPLTLLLTPPLTITRSLSASAAHSPQ